jgi:hypothetical protein
MAVKWIKIGSFGPFKYDDAVSTYALETDGDVSFGSGGGASIKLLDTDESNTLELKWNENDTVNRVLNFLVNSGNRSISLSGNLTVEAASLLNQDLTSDTSPSFLSLFLTGIKSGATQVAAGAVANELWKTSGHATLPDNVVMIGV